MLRLKIQKPMVISCTVRVSPEIFQKLNCAAGYAKPDLTPKQVAKIIKSTPESDFILKCFQIDGGTSRANKRFREALDDYNEEYGTNIDNAQLIKLIKSWCSQHGYNESQSKKGASTGGAYDDRNMYIYKVPMQTLFKKNPDGRGTVMDGPVTFDDGIDRLYIKLSLESAGTPIDVVSFHRDSDGSNQRNTVVQPKHDKTHHPRQKPDEKDADEGMLEEQPEKVAARNAYNRRKR